MSNKANRVPTLPTPVPYMVRAILGWITDNDQTPHVMFDATQPNVVVPPSAVRENGQCILNLSMSATHNLSVDDDFITFHARFNGKSEQIFIPLGALIAIFSKENGQGMALQGIHEYHQRTSQALGGPRAMIQMGVSDTTTTQAARDVPPTTQLDPVPPPEPTPRKRGHLTLVSSK